MLGNYSYIPLYIASITFVIGASLIFINIKDNSEKRNYNRKFSSGLRSATRTSISISGDRKKSKNPIENMAYMIKKSFPKLDKSTEQLTVIILATFGGLLLISMLVFGNPMLALFAAIAVFAGLKMMSERNESRRKMALEEQLPSFIATFKSNLQANQPASTALMNAIDNANQPLYDEVRIAKAMAQTGTLKSALVTLRKNTTNESLRFLCACIELSSDTGGELESQIEEIERLLKVKREHERKLDKAESENKPLIYVSAAIIPGMFLYIYFTQEVARDFWFKSTISWVILGTVAIAYTLAIWGANKVVKGVRG